MIRLITFLGRRRYSLAMSIVTTLTVVSGAWLYWRDSSGFQLDWLTSGAGRGFGIGALAALVSYIIGIAVIGPVGKRISALGEAMQSAGGPPSAEQLAEIGKAQRTMSSVLRWDFPADGRAAHDGDRALLVNQVKDAEEKKR